MSNYCVNEQMCRVDIFKASGKWCETEEIEFQNWCRSNLIHDEFRAALNRALNE